MAFKDSYQKICATCKKQFEASNARTKYCSDSCKYEKCKCLVCQTEFLRKGNTTGKFCSSDCWYQYYDNQNIKKCLQCNELFEATHSSQKYCSKTCAHMARRVPRKNKTCGTCGISIEKKHPRQKYCSVKCAQTGRIRVGSSSKPIGTRSSAANGYIQVKVGKEHPSASKQGWMLEHRYVMEQKLGRHLSRKERVHHKNGVRNDNRAENLERGS